MKRRLSTGNRHCAFEDVKTLFQDHLVIGRKLQIFYTNAFTSPAHNPGLDINRLIFEGKEHHKNNDIARTEVRRIIQLYQQTTQAEVPYLRGSFVTIYCQLQVKTYSRVFPPIDVHLRLIPFFSKGPVRQPAAFRLVSPPSTEPFVNTKTILILLGCQRFRRLDASLFGGPEPIGNTVRPHEAIVTHPIFSLSS